MTKLTSRSICITLALALGACTAHQDEAGAVSLAITATGSDGATYALPAGTRLTLATSLIPNYDVALDGSGTDVQVSVTAGSYQAEIYNTDNNYTTQWPLLRSNSDGSTTPVTATLVTPQPQMLTVTTGQTTALGFQFVIPSGGTVVFGHGTVDVSIGVGTQPASSFTAAVQGTGDIQGTPTFTGPYAPNLMAVMPGPGATGLQISVNATLTGSFQEAGGSIDATASSLSVCAPISITSSSAMGSPGFSALIAESGHGDAPGFLFGPATLCIVDNGTTNQARIRLSRQGPAETATFMMIFGGMPVLFWNVIVGDLPQRVYDGSSGTLQLGALAGTYSVPMRMTNRIGADLAQLWYFDVVIGQMNFSFVPQL
jgi:hypothetical protein